MGNNASQSGNIARQQQPEQQEEQWAHSFPRTLQRLNQHKVLPNVSGDVHQKLKPTNNGEILFNGGTISGRHQSSSLSLPREELPNGVYKSNSISSKQPEESYDSKDSSNQRHYIPHVHQRDHMHRSPVRKNRNLPSELRHPHGHNAQQKEKQMKRFGSVPDLRGRDAIENGHREKDVSRGKKKYKAPPPPMGNITSNGSSLDSWDIVINGEPDSPMRKARLFKTRAEMKKKPSSPQNHRRNIYPQNHEITKYRARSREPYKGEENERNNQNQSNRSSLSEMQRSRSLPEFQAELREVTKRLRSSKSRQKGEQLENNTEVLEKNLITHSYSSYESKENKLKTLDLNVCKKDHIKYKMKQYYEKTQMQESNINIDKSVNTKRIEDIPPSIRKESVDKPQNSRKKSVPHEQPSKTFYFGMDEPTHENSSHSNVVDNFALNVRKYNLTQTYSGSDLSSEIDIDDNQLSSNGIALHLRPILPKKQLEIPRFSPAAAWRLLSTFDSNPPPSTVSDEGPVLIEEKIEKMARLPPPMNILGLDPRSSHDKSGDSGISGDAGPPVFEENSDPLRLMSRNDNLQISSPNGALNMSWTPQQDLEGDEESNSEDGRTNKRYVRNISNVKFSPRSQVFSLSLPRDNHLAAYMEEKARQHTPLNFTNLQRLKRSVSGVLGNISGKKDAPNLAEDQNNNWFLSRSAPNSLNNGFNSLEIRVSKEKSNIPPETAEERISLVPIVNNTTNTNEGRVMYLPECKENHALASYLHVSTDNNQYKQQTKKVTNYKSKKGIDCSELNTNKNSNSRYSNMSKSCENISGVISKSACEPEDLQDPPPVEAEKFKGRKQKRFTFQSTVRQIERKRLAEKLSREAERKERQRLSELEAMRRVEEEFQRKRAKEKASIRQQLRLFSLDDAVWSSLPPNWDDNKDPARSEPDGAVSSSSSSPSIDNLNSNPPMNVFNYSDMKNEKSFKTTENKSLVLKNILTRQGSESSDDTRVKAQATQVLSEYRQPRREYKDYRILSRCLGDTNDGHETKQTTVHPQVTYNMPKAHGQGSTADGTSKSNNYRRDFAHGIMLPTKNIDSYSEESTINIHKYSPRITQSQRTRQGKCIS